MGKNVRYTTGMEELLEPDEADGESKGKLTEEGDT